MSDYQVPTFVRTPEPRALLARMTLGAVLGAIGGVALYLNDKHIAQNMMNQVNAEVRTWKVTEH